jgi:hypothetical protein
VGRVADWLFTPTPAVHAAAPVPAIAGAASAGRLATSSTSRANTPYGFGPPLAPFTFEGVAPPWWDRDAAMSLPTISRGRDLICSAVSGLPFTFWTVNASTLPVVERQIPPYSWWTRPDPDRTRQWLLSWTVDDLLFYEQAHWLVTDRYATTFPSAFRRIPPGDLQIDNGVITVTDADGKRRQVPPRDVIEFLSPLEGLLSNGWRAISIAMQLDAAADRFAGTEVPAGVLEEQDTAEEMSADELQELAEQFALARHMNTTAATNRHVRYREIDYDASKMQLVEGRTYQALELARLANIPPYLVGAPAGTGMTYQNGQQARRDLLDFGAAPFLACIDQTLSGPNVTPAGTAVRLDRSVWLDEPAELHRDPLVPDPAPTPTVTAP